MKSLNLAFIYRKHDTLRYVTFLYTKIQTLRKEQDNLRYVFKYKNQDTLRYEVFHGIFEIGRGGGHFLFLTCFIRAGPYLEPFFTALVKVILGLISTYRVHHSIQRVLFHR